MDIGLIQFMVFDKKIMFGFLFLCVFSCSKNDSESCKECMKTFRTSSWEIEIPQSYSVDSSYHWDRGISYFVKNKLNETVITIHGGLVTDNTLVEKQIYSTDNYSVNNKIDTTIYWEDKYYKKRIVVLQVSNIVEQIVDGYPEKYNVPKMLEFWCFLDYIKPQMCEKIIFSTKNNSMNASSTVIPPKK